MFIIVWSLHLKQVPSISMCPSAFTLKPSDCESTGQSCLKIKSAVRRLHQSTRDVLRVQAKQQFGEQLSTCRAQGTGGLQDPRCSTPACHPGVPISWGWVAFPSSGSPSESRVWSAKVCDTEQGAEGWLGGSLWPFGQLCPASPVSPCGVEGRGVLLCRAGDISGCSW